MEPNIPTQVSTQDIRLMLLESWVQGEVADSMPGQDPARWVYAAKELKKDLDIHLDAPYEDKIAGVVYLRANHGFPLEMHWRSPEARQWLNAVPERRVQRDMWNDMFLERGGLA